ncbi:MAG: hypothetical protein LBV38_06895 [Alistipes sp.]|nr:hypothetical protein [Alistipes sp.]
MAGEPSANLSGEGEKQTRRQRFDRGLAFDTRTPSMPKGMWVAGIGGAYSRHDNNDYGVFILDQLNSEGNTMTISPMLHYVFANNQSVGVRFQYRHSLFDMADATFHLTPELSSMLFGDEGLMYRYERDSFMGLLSYRYYVSIGSSRRLLFFNEVQAGFGGGSGREDSGLTDAGGFKRSTWQKSLDFRLGFSPGATVFVTNHAAIELQIGLLGYEFQRLTQEASTAATTPDEIGVPPVKGSRITHNVSARFDILSVAFGATFYL